ncbi:MAG: energy-coupling factor transporter ATPase [Bacilli bacterium]
MPIKVNDLFYYYNYKKDDEKLALKNINLELKEPFFVAFVGETGSGKSTLIQHFNGLLKPTFGQVNVNEFVLTNSKKKNKNIQKLRQNVGIVFQFSEYQLFEETVLKDVMAGPKAFLKKENDAKEIAKESLTKVGINESYYERSPFDLSGGEKRRVAIAGVLAIKPNILVLDEPTAGLDNKGEKEIMDLLLKMYESGISIALVTHDMNLVMKYTNRVIALSEGEVIYDGSPKELFLSLNENTALEIPSLYRFISSLNKNGFHLNYQNINDVDSLIKEIKKEVKEHE